MKVITRLGVSELTSRVWMTFANHGRHANKLTIHATWSENNLDCSLAWSPDQYNEDGFGIVSFYCQDDTWYLYKDKQTAETTRELCAGAMSEDHTPEEIEHEVNRMMSVKDAELVLGVIIQRRLDDLRRRWEAINLIMEIQ